jgi:CRP-like cAMP-binding protein
VIFRLGDPGDGLYGVLAGEVALLDGKGRSATALARQPSELLFLGRAAFLPFLAARPALAVRMLALLCERLRRTTELVEDSLFRNVPERLARQLGALVSRQMGEVRPEGPVTLVISQAELARMLGVSREIVSRHLLLWREAGLVELGRERIVLRDTRALDRLLAGT